MDTHDVRFILTTGDNIYASKKVFGIPIGGQGDEDDNWYFTYYQPYRYIINRLPVYPVSATTTPGNRRPRRPRSSTRQLLHRRTHKRRRIGRTRVHRSRVVLPLPLRIRHRVHLHRFFARVDFSPRLYKHPKHADFLSKALPAGNTAESPAPLWRIPFLHHPPFCAGPTHHNTSGMEELVERFRLAGVRVVFSGHEHNFQHSLFEGLNCFVSGAAASCGKGQTDPI